MLGKEFNKVQMLMTVAALAVGVLVDSPLVSPSHLPSSFSLIALSDPIRGAILVSSMSESVDPDANIHQVRRKQINMRWQMGVS